MGNLTKRYESLIKALNTLNKSIDNHKLIISKAGTKESAYGLDFSDLYLATRESMIQRFEYSVDLYWKFLKDYLEFELKTIPRPSGPKNIIRECTKAKVLTEDEGILALEMIDCRNMSSHIYREEIAEQISMQIPCFYDLMKKITISLPPS